MLTPRTIAQRTILIAGPTASGKSALAVRLAERHGGVVINADSMQVYRDLTVLTARPTAEDMGRCPHLLYGHVDGAEAYSVGRWINDVRSALSEARDQGLLPIVVGGTGLYFKALLEGLSPIPGIPTHVREYWRAEVERVGVAALHRLLAERDPATAGRVATSDAQRITRALEVLEATGRRISDWQREPGEPVLVSADAVLLVAAPSRAELYERAERRLDVMMAHGAREEVGRLGDRHLPERLPIMGALGVEPLLAAGRGDCTPEEAIAQAKQDTRRYIKRQETWLKRYMIAWNWLSTQEMECFSDQDFTLIQM